MGNVVNILDAKKIEYSKSFIDFCYENLSALPNFVVRAEQKKLSEEVCASFCSNKPLVAEAPTGTGKTLAYLIGALAAADKLNVTKPIPIVIATATVGLQSQILSGDVPILISAGIISKNDVVIAKGRSRYLCIQSAEKVLEEAEESSQQDIFDSIFNEQAANVYEVKELMELWNNKTWSGDSDSYPKQLPQFWPKIQAASETCTAQKCDYYAQCPFFNSRRALSSATIIVANHDMVLADLIMDKEKTDPLFPGGKYLAVFDEAHHLPDKALDVGSAEINLNDILADLPKFNSFNKQWQKQGDLIRLFAKAKLEADDFEPLSLINSLTALKQETDRLSYEPDTLQNRFLAGEAPSDIQKLAELSKIHSAELLDSIQKAISSLKQTNLIEKNNSLKAIVVDMLHQTAFLNSKLMRLDKALTLFCSKARAVKWAYKSPAFTSLHVSPLEGADVLVPLLWSNPRLVPVFVSATLKDFDSFERFLERIGAPPNVKTIEFPHIFPYKNNTLYVVDMINSPTWETRDKFKKELSSCLPDFIDEEEGTLILFPSKALMKEIVPVLKAKFKQKIICQGDKGIKELVKSHKDAIDSGKGSILCGLAVLAEGLDLPGKYCTHVVICTLPFSVPTTPVEQELQEILGKEYFSKRALPDTLIKLIQMVGRLMRRETDLGRITIFDNRIQHSNWGNKLLNALPPFSRKLVKPELFSFKDLN